MKEKENTATPGKKRLLYSIILAVCAILLITATVLTVYFVTKGGSETLENPPAGGSGENPGGTIPGGSEQKPDDTPSGGEQKPDDTPTGGEQAATFISPIASEIPCAVEYNVIYENKTTEKWYRHKALDFKAAEGTEVCAMGDATVVKLSCSEELGNVIVLDHGDGIYTTYRFVEPVSGLREGDKVKQGQKIATVAAPYGTEAEDGAHLHLEMEVEGETVNPADYFNITLEEK